MQTERQHEIDSSSLIFSAGQGDGLFPKCNQNNVMKTDQNMNLKPDLCLRSAMHGRDSQVTAAATSFRIAGAPLQGHYTMTGVLSKQRKEHHSATITTANVALLQKLLTETLKSEMDSTDSSDGESDKDDASERFETSGSRKVPKYLVSRAFCTSREEKGVYKEESSADTSSADDGSCSKGSKSDGNHCAVLRCFETQTKPRRMCSRDRHKVGFKAAAEEDAVPQHLLASAARPADLMMSVNMKPSKMLVSSMNQKASFDSNVQAAKSTSQTDSDGHTSEEDAHVTDSSEEHSGSEWEPADDCYLTSSDGSQDNGATPGDVLDDVNPKGRAIKSKTVATNKQLHSNFGRAQGRDKPKGGPAAATVKKARPPLCLLDTNAQQLSGRKTHSREVGGSAENMIPFRIAGHGVSLSPGNHTIEQCASEVAGKTKDHAGCATGAGDKQGLNRRKQAKSARNQSSLPVVIPAGVAKQQGRDQGQLVLCEMPAALCLDGDMGTIGRVVSRMEVASTGEEDPRVQLDLKGIVYETEIVELAGTAALARLAGQTVVVDAFFGAAIRTHAGEDYCKWNEEGLLRGEDMYSSDACNHAAAEDGAAADKKAAGNSRRAPGRKKPLGHSAKRKGPETARAMKKRRCPQKSKAKGSVAKTRTKM